MLSIGKLTVQHFTAPIASANLHFAMLEDQINSHASAGNIQAGGE